MLPALLLLCFGSNAATKTYFGGNNGNWTINSNWNSAGEPVAGDDVFLGSHSPAAGTVNLSVNFNGVYQVANRLKSVTVNSSGIDGFMIVNQTSASSIMSVETMNIGTSSVKNTYNQTAGVANVVELNVGINSSQNTYNLSGSASYDGSVMNLGVSGSGTFNQSGGKVVLQGATVNFPGFPSYYAAAELNMGVKAGGVGAYNLSGGTLTVDALNMAGAGSSTFSQTGGALWGGVAVGGGSGTGVFNISAGELQATVSVAKNGTFKLKSGAAVTGDSRLTLETGGVFENQGGQFVKAPELKMAGGTLRLNGHNMTFSDLEGTSGTIESGTGSAVLTVDYISTYQKSSFAGNLQDGAFGMLGLTKTGGDPLELGGINTYSGVTTLQAGKLRAGSNTAFSSKSEFLVTGGTLDANGKDVSFGALSGSGGTVALSTGTVTLGGANLNTTYAGTITGSGTINKVGTGQQTLSGASTFSGTVNVLAGALRVGAVDGLPTASTLNLAGSGTVLSVAANQTLAALSGVSNTTLSFLNGSQLTIGAGNTDTTFAGGFIGAGTLAKTGTGTFTLGAGASDNMNANKSTGLSFAVSAGTLALNKAEGSNALAGALQINGGSVSLARSHQIANTSVLTMTGGNFDLNGFTETIGGLNGTGGGVNLGGGNLTVLQNVAGTFGGQIHGGGSFIKAGAADLTLTAPGSFIGKVNVDGGRLVLQGGFNATGYNVSSGSTLRFEGGTLSLGSGPITASAGAAVEYSNTTVNNGFLRGPGQHTLLAGSTNAFNAVTTYNSTTLLQNGTASFSNFSNGGKLINHASATLDGGSNTSSGIINVNSTLATSDFTNNGVINIYSGGSLANSGSSLVLGGGSRSYVNSGGSLTTGPGTTIELNGALLVNNGVMSGRTNVNYGSTAKGAGVFGAISVTEGGRFSPGNSPGLATVNGFVLGAGGSYQFEMNDANGMPGIGFDFVDNLGELYVEAGTTPSTQFHIELVSLNLSNAAGLALNFDASQARDFTLVHNALGISGFNADMIVVDSSAFLNPTNGGTFSVVASGNDLMLHFSPSAVPEPSVTGLLLAGIACLGWRMRSRKLAPV